MKKEQILNFLKSKDIWFWIAAAMLMALLAFVLHDCAYALAAVIPTASGRIISGTPLTTETQEHLSVSACAPWRIMAITFTNKAAGELKDRLCAMLGETANDIWASTFHSTCARILRRDGERIGYSSHFTVYDTDDQRRLMKNILKELEVRKKLLIRLMFLIDLNYTERKQKYLLTQLLSAVMM